MAAVERHMVLNPEDWSAEYFFEQIGAFDASDRRFCLFIEGLASPDLRPDETSQREFVAAVNEGLLGKGFELREVDADGGFPVFRFANIAHGTGRPKNLIFASSEKPDLRFRDAVNNDIEIVNGADKVLVYDRPFPAEGLRWRDLQAWWKDLHGVEDQQAKRDLYLRLLRALPENSPPQRLLFETFFKSFSAYIQDLPALLPEVWLHWDPKTVRTRGPEALGRFRMDFLMLFSHEIRVVIEVDGRHHYANDAGNADPIRYAEMAKADRELRLAGYEVFRFGAAELDGTKGAERVSSFFSELFERYRVTVE
jgi:very-short-patch-repair endonuclease